MLILNFVKAVILGGGYDATPTSCQASDRVRTSDGTKSTLPATTRELAQGLRSPNSVCNRCGGRLST